MRLVADANVAIAALDPAHRFHRVVIRRCLEADGVLILNLTRAEALIHPTRVGKFEAADRELGRLGFETVPLDSEVADRSRVLRATYVNKNFPLVDAVVVALGVELGSTVVTCDAKWPAISEAEIEVLA